MVRELDAIMSSLDIPERGATYLTKATKVIARKLAPIMSRDAAILCVGETLDQRKSGKPQQ